MRRSLQDADFDVAGKVVALLDQAGMKLAVAMWMESAGFEEGRLVLAAAEFDKISLLEAYERVFRILEEYQFRHPMFPLVIFRTSDPLIREVRKRFGKGDGHEGMRLAGQVIGGHSIIDAYVFHIS
jgi:hypothetical protein